MKKTIAILLLAASAAAEPSLPADAKGQVSLSWDKFNELWTTIVDMDKKIKNLEAPVAAPPVPFALSGAAYRGAVKPGRVVMEAVFALEVFEPKAWVKVPFLPASVAVTEALLDGKPLGLVDENGMHAALVRGVGRHTLQVQVSLKAPTEEEAPAFDMPIPQTAMTAVSLLFPQPHLEVTVDGAQGQESRPEAGGTRVTAALSPASAIRLRWHRALPTEKALPRKVYVEGETLFTVSEGALRGRWTFRYTVLHRAMQEVALRLPEGWNVLNVWTDGLEEWKVADGPDGARLLVRFTYPRKGNLEVSIEAERGLAEKEDLVPLPRLAPLDVERETGVIAIQAKGAVEVTVPGPEGVQGLDPQELPPSVWGQAQHPILYAFRHTGRPSLALAVTRHPDVPVLTTTVDLANAVTVMTKRGETVTRIQYRVRNRVKQHLTLRLPDGADLWSAFVAGQPVKPTRLPEGSYRLPLARASAEGGTDEVLVEVVYFARGGAFGVVGRREMRLPLPDAPVSRALWSFYLPPEARPVSFGGDMDKEEAVLRPMAWGEPRFLARQLAGALSLRKAVVSRSEVVDEAKDSGEALPPSAPEQFQNRLLADSLDAREDGSRDGSRRAGVFPVAFQIPAEGALYHFGRSMIVGESPRVRLAYARQGVFTLLWWLFLAAAAGLAYRARRRLAPLADFLKRPLFRRREEEI